MKTSPEIIIFYPKQPINGMMSADIFKRTIAHAIQLKWTFLGLKWAVFVLKLCPIFPRKQPLQIAYKT
jgi:hypothetical protein